MRPFTPAPDGWRSHLDEAEAVLFARAAREVVALLDAPVLDPALMGALVDEDTRAAQGANDSLGNLLGPMSNDPAIESEMRSLTEETLRIDKSARMCRLIDALDRCVHEGGVVTVTQGEEWTWLGALTDLRLALAGTLHAHSKEDVEAVTEYALSPDEQSNNPEGIGGRDLLVSQVFVLLGAWQESLLAAMDMAGGPQ